MASLPGVPSSDIGCKTWWIEYSKDLVQMYSLLQLGHQLAPQGLDRRREEILSPALVDPRQIAHFQHIGLVAVVDSERGLRVLGEVALADDGVLARDYLPPLLSRKDLVAGPA